MIRSFFTVLVVMTLLSTSNSIPRETPTPEGEPWVNPWAQVCEGRKWRTLAPARQANTPFESQAACVRYATRGLLVVPVVTRWFEVEWDANCSTYTLTHEGFQPGMRYEMEYLLYREEGINVIPGAVHINDASGIWTGIWLNFESFGPWPPMAYRIDNLTTPFVPLCDPARSY